MDIGAKARLRRTRSSLKAGPSSPRSRMAPLDLKAKRLPRQATGPEPAGAARACADSVRDRHHAPCAPPVGSRRAAAKGRRSGALSTNPAEAPERPVAAPPTPQHATCEICERPRAFGARNLSGPRGFCAEQRSHARKSAAPTKSRRLASTSLETPGRSYWERRMRSFRRLSRRPRSRFLLLLSSPPSSTCP